LPDAADYGDEGSNTIGNLSRARGGLRLPNLGSMGLGRLTEVTGVPPVEPGRATAAFGRMAELSPGKDTITGHWEMAGIILDRPIKTYPHGFPPEVIEPFEKAIGRKVLGNIVASGTEIIKELGEDHMKTGRPIVYTSADSVFQIAAHEEVVPLELLYHWCEIARSQLTGEHVVGRVIARPFLGRPGSFTRTENRHDYSLKPPHQMLLDNIVEAGLPVMTVGKIIDIFAGQGVTAQRKTGNNAEGIEATREYIAEGGPGLIFTNLVDFDMLYGHRNNVEGYAEALEEFDRRLPELLSVTRPGDCLFIVADHGCDPTTPSTDHSREYTPLLVWGGAVKAGTDLGTRRTMADVGATIAEMLAVPPIGIGTSFARDVLGQT
jgi:phosphopentomutase